MIAVAHHDDSHREPDWQVQGVFDPDGEGHEFAYTIGLVDRGLPELHIWARPPLGDDPGDDWMLSLHDRTHLLNKLAWQLIDGELEVGAQWSQTYDGGLVTVRFSLDPLGDRDELEAFGIAPGALVLPVRWSLHRPPVGEPQPLTGRALGRAESEYAAILADPVDLVAPPGWSLPAAFAPGGAFGPLTPLVHARAAEFWSADPITLSNLCWAGTTAEQGGSVIYPAAIAAAVAREAGRVTDVDRARVAARELVAARTDRDDWPATCVELKAAMDYDPDEVTPEQLGRNIAGLLEAMLWTVLTTEVVADRLTAAQRLAGRGAWLTGLGPVGELPGRAWRAPTPVLDRVVGLLEPLDVEELRELVRRFRNDDDHELAAVANRVQGWAINAAAGCPWSGVLDRLPAVRRLMREVSRDFVPVLLMLHAPLSPGIDGLQEWSTVMTSAMVHRDRLSPHDIAVLTAPFLDLVPGLPHAIRG